MPRDRPRARRSRAPASWRVLDASGHDRSRWCASVVRSGRLQDPSRASRSRLLLAPRESFAQRDEAQQQDPRLPLGAGNFLGARACDREASRNGALPWPAGSEEPAVAGLFYLKYCMLRLLLHRREPLAGRRRLGESG